MMLRSSGSHRFQERFFYSITKKNALKNRPYIFFEIQIDIKERKLWSRQQQRKAVRGTSRGI